MRQFLFIHPMVSCCMRKITLSVFIIASFLFSVSCQPLQISTVQTETDLPIQKADDEDPVSTMPRVDREFRAAWVATVANINWPSSRDLTVEQQKKEAIALLDLLQKTNYNAVIFQVRPQSDALYQSNLEPWSYYLTGKQGVAPSPFYDPLNFWIEEAHKRGLELHVWLNPYRAHHTAGGPISEHSVVNTMSDVVVELESGFYWLDPSSKKTQNHAHAVVMDIVKRYDVDGVHFDDYFYPYTSYNNGKDFPDRKNWNKYLANGGTMSRSDWRRNAVDVFVERIYHSIKKEKPYVKFGLSPFGVWRPNNPLSITGLDQYEVLFADAKKWLNEGWVDYFSPQLYWPINQIEQSFPVLLGWWKSQNTKNRNLWPGINIGLFEGEKKVDEVFNQIMITRGMLPKAPGTIHWSITPLVKDYSLQSVLLTYPYAKKALVPPMNPEYARKSSKPDISIKYGHNNLTIKLNEKSNSISNWVIHAKYGGRWETIIQSRTNLEVVLPFLKIEDSPEYSPFKLSPVFLLEELKITQVNRFGIESAPTIIVPCNFDCKE